METQKTRGQACCSVMQGGDSWVDCIQMSLRLASEHSVDSCPGSASRGGGQGQPWKGDSLLPLNTLDGGKNPLTSLPSHLTNGPHCPIERSRQQLHNMMVRGLDSLAQTL